LEYPPELPIEIAHELLSDLNGQHSRFALLLGAGLPSELVSKIIKTFPKKNLKPDLEEIGFSLLKNNQNEAILTYSPPGMENPDNHENMSLALHVFKYLGYENVTIIDGVIPIDNNSESIFHVVDHINLTGINPLDYWMMPYEPKPFFLDVQDLYVTEGFKNLPKTAHLAISEETAASRHIDVKKTGAMVYGCAFCPESIISGYLGMKVLAIGVILPLSERIDRLTGRIFEIISE